MGATESCCGNRRPVEVPVTPSRPISALGNQYVTFQPDQQEIFLLKQGVWISSQFEVKDIVRNPWFKLEGKDSQATGNKKLVLNTGVHHASVERGVDGSAWHVYVGNERRVTVCRDSMDLAGGYRYVVWLHSLPYPTRSAGDKAGTSEPKIYAQGNFGGLDYWFLESDSRDNRRIARVTRDPVSDLSLHNSADPVPSRLDSDAYLVQVAAAVDVALVVLVAVVIEYCEVSEKAASKQGFHLPEPSPFAVGRAANGTPPGGVGVGGAGAGGGGALKVPPLWNKGATPRN